MGQMIDAQSLMVLAFAKLLPGNWMPAPWQMTRESAPRDTIH